MLRLLLWPFVLSFLNTGVWVGLRYLGISSLISGDEGVMVSGTNALGIVLYALLAGFITVTVWNQWEAVHDAVKSKDREKFKLYKNKRLPKPLKMLLALYSLYIAGGFHLTLYRNLLDGVYTAFGIALLLSTVWAVVMDLDDPFTGFWNVKVPKEWLDEDDGSA